MKLNAYALATAVFIMLFGGIGFTGAINWWQTESTKVPEKYTEGEAAGAYNPADIRGSYTFGEVSDLFGIPLVDLQTAFRIPADADPASYPLKSLEAISGELPVEVGTASVRMFVAFYKGLPYDLSASEETYLFPEAADILKEQNKLLPEQLAYLENHLVPETPNEGAPAESTSTEAERIATPEVDAAVPPDPTEHIAPDRTVNGQTTFQDLLDWGVTQPTIEEILGGAMPAPQTLIKDYMTQKGLEFSSVKTQFQAEVDQHQ